MAAASSWQEGLGATALVEMDDSDDEGLNWNEFPDGYDFPSADECSPELLTPGRRTPSKHEAWEQLAGYLEDRVLKGKMEAKEATTLAYWATMGGCKGRVADLAFNPLAPSGHASRHFKRVVAMDNLDEHFMEVHAPGASRDTYGQVTHTLWMIPPHKALHRESARDR